MKKKCLGCLLVFLGLGSLALAGPAAQAEDKPGLALGAVTVAPGEAQTTAGEPSPAKTEPYDKPAFWGTRLINLPTTTVMAKRDVLFRLSHRFYGPVDEGYEGFFGLDSGANVLLSLGIGISDRVGITIARTRLNREVTFGLNWLAIEQGSTAGLPFSAAVHAGLDWATVEGSGYVKTDLQIALSHQLTRRLSFLVVPSFCSNTDFLALEPEGTFAVGLGARYMIFEDLSLLGEWVPVVAGYRDVENSWGVGLEKKIGLHVFQVFVTNSFGLTASQFVPGGDLRFADFDVRIGFNIFRTF